MNVRIRGRGTDTKSTRDPDGCTGTFVALLTRRILGLDVVKAIEWARRGDERAGQEGD